MRMSDFLSIVLLTHSSKNILTLYITIKNRIFLNKCVSIDTTQSSSEEVFDKKNVIWMEGYLVKYKIIYIIITNDQ